MSKSIVFWGSKKGEGRRVR